jgi:hypothetical protein
LCSGVLAAVKPEGSFFPDHGPSPSPQPDHADRVRQGPRCNEITGGSSIDRTTTDSQRIRRCFRPRAYGYQKCAYVHQPALGIDEPPGCDALVILDVHVILDA